MGLSHNPALNSSSSSSFTSTPSSSQNGHRYGQFVHQRLVKIIQEESLLGVGLWFQSKEASRAPALNLSGAQCCLSWPSPTAGERIDFVLQRNRSGRISVHSVAVKEDSMKKRPLTTANAPNPGCSGSGVVQERLKKEKEEDVAARRGEMEPKKINFPSAAVTYQGQVSTESQNLTQKQDDKINAEAERGDPPLDKS